MEQGAPVVQVGKKGLTESTIAHIARILRQRKCVKVKLLHSFAETAPPEEAARILHEATGAKRVALVGFVVTLYK